MHLAFIAVLLAGKAPFWEGTAEEKNAFWKAHTAQSMDEAMWNVMHRYLVDDKTIYPATTAALGVGQVEVDVVHGTQPSPAMATPAHTNLLARQFPKAKVRTCMQIALFDTPCF